MDDSALRAKAEKATRGPWFSNGYSSISAANKVEPYEQWLESEDGKRFLAQAEHQRGPLHDKEYELDPNVAYVPAHHGDTATGQHADDREYIAACSPERILALLDRVAAAEAVVKAAVEFSDADAEWDAIHDEDVAKTEAAPYPNWNKRMAASATRGMMAARNLLAAVSEWRRAKEGE